MSESLPSGVVRPDVRLIQRGVDVEGGGPVEKALPRQLPGEAREGQVGGEEGHGRRLVVVAIGGRISLLKWTPRQSKQPSQRWGRAIRHPRSFTVKWQAVVMVESRQKGQRGEESRGKGRRRRFPAREAMLVSKRVDVVKA